MFLTEAKGYTDQGQPSSPSPSSPALPEGITCGWISDKFFQHRRNVPCLLFGIFFLLSTATFVYVPAGYPWSDYVSMVFFGYTVCALVTYLGGLMAVDICSRKPRRAMGVIGLFSYAGASLQEGVGGYLLNSHKIIGRMAKSFMISPPPVILGDRLGLCLVAPLVGLERQT